MNILIKVVATPFFSNLICCNILIKVDKGHLFIHNKRSDSWIQINMWVYTCSLYLKKSGFIVDSFPWTYFSSDQTTLSAREHDYIYRQKSFLDKTHHNNVYVLCHVKYVLV